jgi:hypothetical protein
MKKKCSIVKFCRCQQCRPDARVAVRAGHRKFRQLTKQALRRNEDPPGKLYLSYLD